MRWLLFVAFLPGCSFAFVQTPPENHEKLRYFDCDSGGGSMAADITGAVLGGAMTLILATPSEPSERPPSSAPVTFGTVSAIYVASAIYGGVNGTSCKRAKAQLSERIQHDYEEHRRRTEELEQEARAMKASRGCTADVDCKGQRLCEAGLCVDPPSPPLNPSIGVVPTGASSVSPGPKLPELLPHAQQPIPERAPDTAQDTLKSAQ